MKSKLISLLLAGAAAATVPACMGTTHGYVAVESYEEAPPPLREEYVSYRPGYVWIHGNWQRGYGNRWQWQNGYYVRERAGYVYQDGYWQRRNRGYVYIRGSWRPHGQVVIRDHRRF